VRARHRLVTALAAGACVALVAACGSSNSGSSGGSSSSAPIYILASAGTGQPGTLGQNAVVADNAVKAAVKVINDAGGIMGHKVVATYVDDEGDPTTAVSLLEQQISAGHKPLAYFDSGPSNLSAAVLPILAQNHILSFNTAPTANSSDAKTFPLNFDLSPSAPNYAVAFCPYAKAHGWTKVGVLYTDDAYGDVLGPDIQSQCQQDGSTVTGIEKYEPTSLDMTPEIQTIEAGHPQAVMLVGYGAEVGYVLNGFQKLGWTVPILGDVAVADTNIVTSPPPAGLMGTAEEKTLKFEAFQSTVAQSNEPANLKTMITALKGQGTIIGSLITAYNYDGVQMLAAAATKANSVTNVSSIATAVIGLTGAKTGIFPQYNYSTTVHAPTEPSSVFTFVTPSTLTNGQFKPAS
jgi:branched-chain amino acid transport system substrate-binding protein